MKHLAPASKRCLDAAQAQSRYRAHRARRAHRRARPQRHLPEPASRKTSSALSSLMGRGQAVSGTIPLTPRANMILGFAQSAAAADGKITPKHLMLGVIAESRDWHQRRFNGPHHLEEAATAAGPSLAEIESILLRP